MPYFTHLHWSSSRHLCSGTPPASTKGEYGSGSVATDKEERLQSFSLPGTPVISSLSTLQMFVGPPDSKAHPHPLLQFFQQPGTPSELVRKAYQTSNSCSLPSQAYRRSPDACLKGGSWASTCWPGASSTHQRLLPQPTTELDDFLGTAGHKNHFGKQMDKQDEKGFIPVTVLLLFL